MTITIYTWFAMILNNVFTAELAENAENKHIFIMPLRILPLRSLRSRAQRAVNSCLNNNELIRNYIKSILPRLMQVINIVFQLMNFVRQ